MYTPWLIITTSENDGARYWNAFYIQPKHSSLKPTKSLITNNTTTNLHRCYTNKHLILLLCWWNGYYATFIRFYIFFLHIFSSTSLIFPLSLQWTHRHSCAVQSASPHTYWKGKPAINYSQVLLTWCLSCTIVAVTAMRVEDEKNDSTEKTAQRIAIQDMKWNETFKCFMMSVRLMLCIEAAPLVITFGRTLPYLVVEQLIFRGFFSHVKITLEIFCLC